MASKGGGTARGPRGTSLEGVKGDSDSASSARKHRVEASVRGEMEGDYVRKNDTNRRYAKRR